MSFPRYPKYKDSGVEWLGEVPEGWRLPRIKAISRISGGGTPSREIPEYWNGDIPWVSPKDMKAERISIAEESITPLGLAQSTSSLHPPNRILMVIRSGILQRVIPVAINDATVAINQDMKAFALDSHACLPAFFLRWVQGLNDRLLLEWAHQGATVESINQALMQNTVIPLPPLPEQAAIATFLDRETAKIDALIAEQQRLIELLQEKRQAVISHAVTKGLNPDAPMKDSGIEWLGEVPEHWRVWPLKSVISKIEQGWSPQCESYPAEEGEWGVLKVGCVNATRFRPEEQKALPQELEPLPLYEVREGDILASRGNTQELVGMATFLSAVRQRLMLSDLLYRFRANPEQASGEYLACAMRSPFGRYQIERDAVGTSASMKKVGQSVLRDLLMTLPPLEEQGDIMASINKQSDQLDELTYAAEQAIALLQERRSALISAAVTGQIDVRGLAGSEAA